MQFYIAAAITIFQSLMVMFEIMIISTFTMVLLTLLSVALMIAIITDVRSRRIPNKLNLAIALGAPLFWVSSGLNLWPGLPIQLLTAAVVFGVFFLLFTFGKIGAGDVKLLGAVALWLPWTAMYAVVLYTALLGLPVIIVFFIEHKLSKREGKVRLPYGVAISLASLFVVGERYFNLFV